MRLKRIQSFSYKVQGESLDVRTMAEEEDGSNESSFGTYMHNLESQVLQMMKQSSRAPKDAWEHFQAFSAAINWKQSWLRALLGFHAFNFLFFLITRNNVDAQTGQFLTICVLVMFSERINSWCSAHHRDFADQNYFDSQGAFTGLLFSGPLLLVCLFQLLNFLRLASSALIRAKRLELAAKRKSDKEKEGKTE